MKLQEIDLGPFKRTKGDLYGMWFVYAPEGNFLVKGMFGLCEEYVKKNFSKYIARWTMWKNGKSRGHWRCSEGMHLSILSRINKYGMIDYSKRMKYKVIFSKSDEILEFRRIPKKWLPEYDRLLAGNGFKVGETYTCELVGDHDVSVYQKGSQQLETFVAGQMSFKVVNSQDYPFLVKDGWEEKASHITIEIARSFGGVGEVFYDIVPYIPVNWFRNIKKV